MERAKIKFVCCPGVRAGSSLKNAQNWRAEDFCISASSRPPRRRKFSKSFRLVRQSREANDRHIHLAAVVANHPLQQQGPSHEPGGEVSEDDLHGVNQTIKHLACGAMSAIASRTLIAPLERVKMEVLLNQHANSWHHAASMVFQEGGVLGFWKGNLLNCIRTAPFKAVNYFAFSTFNRYLHDLSHDRLRGTERFLAGAGAGVAATVTCFPLDVIRTRMMSPKHRYNVFVTISRMLKHEGGGSFYTGCVPAMFSMAMGGAIFYGTYDVLRSYELRRRGLDPYAHDIGHHQMRLSATSTLLYGAMSGMIAEIVTYPFEVIRRKMQLSSILAAQEIPHLVTGSLKPIVKESVMKRIMAAFQLAVKQHGIKGLYSGMLPNILQVLPGSAVAYFVYESMKVVLDVRE